MFVVFGILLTCSIGGFVAMCFTSEIKNNVARIVTTVILAVAVGFGLTGLMIMEHDAQVKTFNNGYCECGGTWDLFDVEKTRNNSSTYYYYKCNNCKEIIQLKYKF